MLLLYPRHGEGKTEIILITEGCVKMKRIRSAFFGLLGILLVTGCQAQYRASALVLLEADETKPSQDVIHSEMQEIHKIAPAFVSADWGYQVQHRVNTSLIEVSVITPDPEASASQCNQIVAKYVNMTNAPVRRRIMAHAAIPTERRR